MRRINSNWANKIARVFAVGCVLILCITAIPLLVSQNAVATPTSWSYTNGMWRGTYQWDATMGPYLTVEYNDGGTWKTAINYAYPAAVKFNRNNGVRTLGICYKGGQGTYNSYLGGASSTPTISGGAGYSYWSAEWYITVPSTQGVIIYEYLFFKAEGTTEATAKMTWGIDLKWEKTGDCSDQDDVNWMENWWIVDLDMGNAYNGMIDYGYPSGQCLGYEATWDMDTAGIAFYDNAPGDAVYSNQYSESNYHGNYADTYKWGGFKNAPDSYTSFYDNDNDQVISGQLWIGIFSHAENPSRSQWYGIKSPLNLDLN
jgi:hypothetical protein